MRKERLREKEEKFLIENVNKETLWDKEFIVYQWYEKTNSKLIESKYKLIFDFLNINLRAVRVVKTELENNSSDKEIFYLNNEDINLYDLLNQPFVAKKRSINKNVFFDRFFKSNNRCKYLLEIEEQEGMENDIVRINPEFTILENVTANKDYLNRNMTIPFTETDLTELSLLIEIFKNK